MRASKALLLSCVALAAIAPSGIAHFRLMEPASWLQENQLGDPQKLGPCGGTSADPGKPSGSVTSVQGGEKLHLKIQLRRRNLWVTASVSDPSRRGSEVELPAGWIEGSLLIFVSVIEEWSAVGLIVEGGLGPRPSFSKKGSLWRSPDKFPASVHMLSTCFRIVFGVRSDAARDSRNGRNRISSCSPGSRSFQPHPGAGPAVQVPAVMFKVVMRRGGGAVYFRSSRFHHLPLHAATHHNSKSMPSFSGIFFGRPAAVPTVRASGSR